MKTRVNLISIAVTLGLAALAAPHAHADDLMQAWRDALAIDPLVASSRSALQATRERVTQARALMLPNAVGSAAVNRQDVDTNLASPRMFTTRSWGVSLTMPLVRMQNFEAYDQSRLQVSIGEAQLEQTTQDLMIRVSQAYFDVLAASDNLATTRAQKRAISEQLASAKRNFEVGTATITDQQEAQARFDLNIAQEVAAENDLAVKRAALSQLTGKPVGELNTIGRGVVLSQPVPARELDWTTAARDFNLPVQQARIASEVARREIERQRYGHMPTLDLVTSLNRSENASLQLLGTKATSAGIGVQLNVPIYAGGAIDARVREAIATSNKSQTDLENARRVAEQGARATFLGVKSGLGQVTALEAAERSSQLALDSNVLGYQVGVRINIDVLNAQQQLFTTRRDLAKARYDVLVNGLKLKQAAGTLRDDDIQSVNALLLAQAPQAAESSGPAGTTAGVIRDVPGNPVPATPPPASGPGSSINSPAGIGETRGRGGRAMKPIGPPPAPATPLDASRNKR